MPPLVPDPFPWSSQRTGNRPLYVSGVSMHVRDEYEAPDTSSCVYDEVISTRTHHGGTTITPLPDGAGAGVSVDGDCEDECCGDEPGIGDLSAAGFGQAQLSRARVSGAARDHRAGGHAQGHPGGAASLPSSPFCSATPGAVEAVSPRRRRSPPAAMGVTKRGGLSMGPPRLQAPPPLQLGHGHEPGDAPGLAPDRAGPVSPEAAGATSAGAPPAGEPSPQRLVADAVREAIAAARRHGWLISEDVEAKAEAASSPGTSPDVASVLHGDGARTSPEAVHGKSIRGQPPTFSLGPPRAVAQAVQLTKGSVPSAAAVGLAGGGLPAASGRTLSGAGVYSSQQFADNVFEHPAVGHMTDVPFPAKRGGVDPQALPVSRALIADFVTRSPAAAK